MSSFIVLFDGAIASAPPPPFTPEILEENGDFILEEDGTPILME
jgi:hypothetical protein